MQPPQPGFEPAPCGGHPAANGRFPRETCANLEHGVLGHLFLRQIPPYRLVPDAASAISNFLSTRLRLGSTPRRVAVGDPCSEGDKQQSEEGALLRAEPRYGYFYFPDDVLCVVPVHFVSPPRGGFFLPRSIHTNKGSNAVIDLSPAMPWTVHR
ncbi:hypothetical protein HPB51_002075 [Rhipicephalus microplus]|uniref:Uncharacterized protein n=1 Tax=Rhipicephalus microplus TaxID=6941 RepID=A0A9J6E5R3_RHIMP|nr:hypothetical protein HPB51_002075 [Rhipicephalus microplus]